MIEKPAVEAFVADINAVCEKHGLFIEGCCLSEGIGGEIEICTRDTIAKPQCNWDGSEDEIFKANKDDPNWYINGFYPKE